MEVSFFKKRHRWGGGFLSPGRAGEDDGIWSPGEMGFVVLLLEGLGGVGGVAEASGRGFPRARGRGREPPPSLRRPHGFLPARARPPRRPGVGASRSARRFSDCTEGLRLLGRFLLRPPPALANRHWTARLPLQRLGGLPLAERDVTQGREQALRMAIGSRAFATEGCTAHFDLGTHWRRGSRGD